MLMDRNRIYFSLFILLSVFLLTITLSRYVHGQGEGKDTASTSGSSGVELSDISQKSIGLKLVEAEVRDLEEVLILSGIVKPEPNKVADVSTRIEGRVEKLYETIGDRVKKGQKLAAILPRQIGNPPLVSISSPISGTVTDRNITLGSTAESNKTLFRIVDLSNVIVEGEVFESDISKIKPGQDARIRVDAYPDRVFKGKVTFIASELDPIKRTLHLWVTVDNTEGLLKPEYFAKLTLVVEQGRETITVPIESIIDDGAEKFVFVKNGNRFVRQDVVTGLSDDRFIEITDGLYPGDEVVTDGNRQIYTKWLFSR
ncbi:MAG: efflux RND transporter periplasmic adaptor subunit [Candidatus Dadabacteria bacterium]|nr:efflux RND transporter periplasmic adaptor subunit [Candidatus Dadabacteria bacterium]